MKNYELMVLSDPTQLCRLCLQTSDDVVNIWETVQDTTIASILDKHFWFQVNKNDGITEWLCQKCWLQTKTFHEFYEKVERFQKCYWDSVGNDGGDNDETVAVDVKDVQLEPDLTIVKCEEPELTLEAINSEVREEDDFEYNDDSNATPQTSNDNSERSDGTSRAHDDRKVLIQRNTASRSDKLINQTIRKEQTKELNGLLREWFTMKCDICNDGEFQTWLDVKRHYRSVHQMIGYLSCCDTKFRRRCELLDHIRRHMINPDSTKLDTQIYEWYNMKCDICPDVVFKTLLDIRRHYRKVHNTRGYLTCCNRKFHKRHSMVAHIQGHTNPDAYRCEQCNRNFKTKYSLQIHISNHVPLDSRAFKCTLCSSSFASEAILRLHTKAKHHAKKFPCEKCNKNYRTQSLLKCHIRTVHTSNNYICEVCAQQFKSKHTLRFHVVKKHSETPEQPKIQCNVCSNWLKNKESLSRHMKEQHNDAKPANCPICNKVVSNKHRLSTHIRTVHGERTHQCTLCDKAFKCAKNLKEHVATHTGEDLYKCQYCDKKFKSNANLYSHRKKAHLAEWTRDNNAQRISSETVNATAVNDKLTVKLEK